MVINDISIRHHQKLIELLTSYAVSITFLVVISLFVLRLFKKCTECCGTYFQKKRKQSAKVSVISKYELISNKRRSTGVPPSSRSSTVTITGLESYRNVEFEIPGMVSCEPVQPADSCSTSGGSTEDCNSSKHITFNDEKFMEEYIQPDANENIYPIQRTKAKQFFRNPEHGRSSTVDYPGIEGQLMPELYESCPRRNQGSSSFGKVSYTLQFEDNSKKKLIMCLHHLSNLKFTKLNENVGQIRMSVKLLPEREYIYKTKQFQRAHNISLNESFTFHSRPRNRDFESRTVIVTIIYICESTGKENIYGEARLPLLSHEIYSQVPTDVSVGVTIPIQNEIGDAQIQLSFSSTQQQLDVILKTIHFTNISLFDKLSGIHIKTYLSLTGGEKHSKKKVISKSLRTNDSLFIEFQDPISFSVTSEDYSICTLKMSIHGKHKIMVKHMSLGKIRIGGDSSGECGRVHWKTALTSQEIAWTMWHPIFSS